MSKKNPNPNLGNPNHNTERGKQSIGDRAYIVGRNTPSHALRTMIRDFYSSHPYADKTVCEAVVVHVPFAGTMNTKKAAWYEQFFDWIGVTNSSVMTTERVKVRVIDDPRHTCLGIPEDNKSVEAQWYPWVQNPSGKQLKIGNIVTMQFNDKGMQNNCNPLENVGVILDIIDTNPRSLHEMFGNCTPTKPNANGKKTSTTMAAICNKTGRIPTRKWASPYNAFGRPDAVAWNPVTGNKIAVDSEGSPDSSKQPEFENLYVTSPLGTRNLGSGAKYHAGVDLKAGLGSDIHAALPGTVKLLYNKSYGHSIMIRHDQYQTPYGGAFYTFYAHLEDPSTALIANISDGATVKGGQIIGKSGNTGKTKGAHLHFECIYNDTAASVIFGQSKSSPVPISFKNQDALRPLDEFFFGPGFKKR